MTDFDDLVDTDGLDGAEEARLRRVHDLLLEAGPPPELPPALLRPPTEPREAEVIEFPLHMRRRVGAWVAVAAAVAGVLFAGGYAFGHSKAKPASFSAARLVSMHGANDARGSIRIGTADAAGNVPMLVSVSGLPQQAARGDYYEVWLTEHGKLVAPCGGFRMHGSRTQVRLSVPYRLGKGDGWVVTTWRAGHTKAGPVVMTTA
jgi:hypothetical protein